MTKYSKALIALIGAVGTWGYTAAANGHIPMQSYFGLAIAINTALGVYAIPNTPKNPVNQDPGGI